MEDFLILKKFIEGDYNKTREEYDDYEKIIFKLIENKKIEDLSLFFSLFCVNSEKDDILMSLIPVVEDYSLEFGVEEYVFTFIKFILSLEENKNEYLYILYKRIVNSREYNLSFEYVLENKLSINDKGRILHFINDVDDYFNK